MKKLRSDSKWNGLPAKQREAVLNWLFDEGLGYAAALQRARLEFGVVASVSSLKRFYQHVAEERRIGEVVSAGGSVAEYRAAAVKVLGMATLKLVMDNHNHDRDGFRHLAVLMKLLLRDKQQVLLSERLGLRRDELAAKGRRERAAAAPSEDGGSRMEDGRAKARRDGAATNEDAGCKLQDGEGKAVQGFASAQKPVAKHERGAGITVQKGASIKGIVG